MSMVHDNAILSYRVDFEHEMLVINTVYHNGELHEKTDVIFTGYLTHWFEKPKKGSIIFEIEEYDPKYFYEYDLGFLEAKRNYCWPIVYQTTDTRSELVRYIQDNGYKAFQISASYGLSGWVLAKQMKIDVSQV